jgi:hypothetical protein
MAMPAENLGLLGRLAWVALEHAPRAADPLLHAGRRWLLPWARVAFPVARHEGHTAAGEAASLIVVGQGMQLDYLSGRLCVGTAAPTKQASIGLHRLRRHLQQALDDADLVLALVPRALAPVLVGRHFLQAPALVDFIRSMDDAGFATTSQSIRSSVRAIRAGPLRPRLSAEPSEFELFYDDFYRPLVADRFGALAVGQPRRVLRRRFRFGGIIWVERDGERLGADLFETRGSGLNMLVHGHRPGLDPASASAVGHANYLFGFDHARRLGCRWVNLGGSLPVMTNGVLRHKRAWGARAQARDETHRTLLVGWRNAGPAVLRLLADCPLLVADGAGLSAIAATTVAGPADPRDAARLYRSLLPEGVDRLIVLAPAGWAPRRRGTDLPAPDRLQLCPAGSSGELRAALEAA